MQEEAASAISLLSHWGGDSYQLKLLLHLCPFHVAFMIYWVNSFFADAFWVSFGFATGELISDSSPGYPKTTPKPFFSNAFCESDSKPQTGEEAGEQEGGKGEAYGNT